MKRARTIRTVVAAVLMLALTLLIVACGDNGGGSSEASVAKGGKPTGEWTFSNWPGYIDPGPNGTVAEFDKTYGTDTKYIEDVNSNTQFFGKMQPLLANGNSGGRSLFVVTDWLAKQMFDLGYLERLNHADLKTVFDNISPALKNDPADPGRQFSVPWQGGLTGIWVITSGPGNDIHSMKDLFDPKYKGKVEVLDEMRDTVPLVMQMQGADPQNFTTEDWQKAIDFLKKETDNGQIRRYTGNDYTEDITAGNIVAALGWSGDRSLIGRNDVEWRNPTDVVCDTFFDQMVIPVGAPNTAAAYAFMNFVYRPEVQADIADYVNYVTPVAGVQPILAKKDPAAAKNPLIFPPASQLAPCSADPNPPGSADEQQKITEEFQNLVTG